MTNSNGHATPDRNEILVYDTAAAPAVQAVKVAVHIRPLIAIERLQGCRDCVTVTPGRPQVQIADSSYTYDHVYGSTGIPSEKIFEECVSPLVDGLFSGYNATVLAYGQTGSGKSYTMGTGYTAGNGTDGIIPKVIEMLFKKMEGASKSMEYRVCASFIEILNEELYDLLTCNDLTTTRPDMHVGPNKSPTAPSKSSIQIRETTDGEITLSGVTEVEISSLHQMATLLEQGSLSRATASTNMNSNSSRSHAILQVTLQQHPKVDILSRNGVVEKSPGDYLHAKLQLVDLAGSERVKRTGADGVRFKEGVHINKGLLALGNVINALGDDKKRKDGGHVPYRDSKLTRILQDSLGGNSRTVMIACISPADSNAEESLNTLKYANRARNIQNKPIVNRDPVMAEMHELRQQLEMLQTELLCYRAGGSLDNSHKLKRRLARLEADNLRLKQELQQARDGLQFCAQRVLDAFMERDALRRKIDLLASGKTWEEAHGLEGHESCSLNESVESLQAYTTKIQKPESHIHYLESAKPQHYEPCFSGPCIKYVNSERFRDGDDAEPHDAYAGNAEIMFKGLEEDESVVKEIEHTRFQVSIDKELQKLNERLQQKEAEMTSIMKVDNSEMTQRFKKKLLVLEEEKNILQMERDKLLLEIENLSCVSDEQTQNMQEIYADKLKDLESQLAELKRKQESQTLLLQQRVHDKDAENYLHEEIQRMKFQKVQLQHKVKQESEHFRCWKAAQEKELMQLKRGGRRNEHEMLKLQALNQRQKMVLQRKTEEAALATRRLKDILESHKSSNRGIFGTGLNGNESFKLKNQKALHQSVDNDLEVAVHMHEVRFNHEKQTELRASLAGELDKLRQEAVLPDYSPTDKCTMNSVHSGSHHAREIRIELLKTMLNTSSNALVTMASDLSEAEEHDRMCSGPSSWKNLQTMGDAKDLLNYVFSVAVDCRCQLWDLNRENKDLKEKMEKLKEMLKQNDSYRSEGHRQQQLAQHALVKPKAIRTFSQVGVDVLKEQGIEEGSFTFSNTKSPAAGDSFPSYIRSDILSIPMGGSQYGFKKINSRMARVKHNHSKPGKLLRWKRSHERWLLQFKWKWQKPWRLSEWIRHGDESFIRPRPSRMLHATDYHWGSHGSR